MPAFGLYTIPVHTGAHMNGFPFAMNPRDHYSHRRARPSFAPAFSPFEDYDRQYPSALAEERLARSRVAAAVAAEREAQRARLAAANALRQQEQRRRQQQAVQRAYLDLFTDLIEDSIPDQYTPHNHHHPQPHPLAPYAHYDELERQRALEMQERKREQLRSLERQRREKEEAERLERERLRRAKELHNVAADREQLLEAMFAILGLDLDEEETSEVPEVPKSKKVHFEGPLDKEALPVRTPSPSSSESEDEAALKIQALFRSHAIRRQAHTSITSLVSKFESLRKDFTFPDTLDFIAPSSPLTALEVPRLAFTPVNAGLHAYEEALMKLMQALDTIESHGNEKVREERRALVKRVERELEELDAWKSWLWRRKVAKEEKKPEVPPALAPEHVAPAASDASVDPSKQTAEVEETPEVVPNTEIESLALPSEDTSVDVEATESPVTESLAVDVKQDIMVPAAEDDAGEAAAPQDLSEAGAGVAPSALEESNATITPEIIGAVAAVPQVSLNSEDNPVDPVDPVSETPDALATPEASDVPVSTEVQVHLTQEDIQLTDTPAVVDTQLIENPSHSANDFDTANNLPSIEVSSPALLSVPLPVAEASDSDTDFESDDVKSLLDEEPNSAVAGERGATGAPSNGPLTDVDVLAIDSDVESQASAASEAKEEFELL